MSFNTWANGRLSGGSAKPVNPNLTADLYSACFPRALGRMWLLLNSTVPGVAGGPVNTASLDEQIYKSLQSSPDYSKSCQLACVTYRDPSIPIAAFPAGYESTRLFYGRFDFSLPTSADPHLGITLLIPEKFVDMSYDGFHLPPYPQQEVMPSGISHIDFHMDCATNYLLRNFWHNFIHEVFHNTNYRTYRDFRGAAREETDFDADNLSNLALVRSYNLPVKCDGNITSAETAEILRLLRANRCNKVFRLRAEDRNVTVTAAAAVPKDTYEDFMEREWRERRTLSGYISGQLLADGHAVTDIAVYFTGNVKLNNGRYERDATGLVIALNRVHFSHKNLRRRSTDRFRRDVAAWVSNDYGNFLTTNTQYKKAATKYWEAFAERVHIPA
jgi:hypothetical protein